MAQKALTTEKVEELRSLRSEGLSVREVAARAGVSEGTASNYTRGIAKPIRGTQVKKEAPSGRRETKDIMDRTSEAKLDSDTIELANRVRKARLQAELDDIDDRKQQRQEVDDMRLRERKLLLQLDETRLGASRGDSGVVTELNQLRSELTELREARHQAELRQMEHRMGQLVASIRQTGLTQYDLMSQAMGKAENLAILATSKVDSFMKSGREDKQLLMGLRLGLSPGEYALLLQGEEPVLSIEDYEMGRRLRAQQDGVPLTKPEPGEYEGLVRLTERRNRQWQAAVDKAARAMGSGGSQVVKTGKPGTVPAPGEPEPVVLKAESKVVQCTRCGTTFDIDLVEAKQAAAGKKLFVHCANPKCGFLLDLTELIPELKPVEVKSPKPECYVAGEGGICDNPYKGGEPYQCQDCQWMMKWT